MDDLHPDLSCPFCHHAYTGERELVMVEAGEIQLGRKSRRPVFLPREDESGELTINWYHLDCYLTRLDFNTSNLPKDSDELCSCCGNSLFESRWVFRIRIGLVDPHNHSFVPFKDDQNLGLLCVDCALDGFGEGNYEEGERVLGVGT